MMGNFTNLDVLFTQQHLTNKLFIRYLCHPMSFVPPNLKSSIPGNPSRYKFEVGGHTGRGTITHGDSRLHLTSAVDTGSVYPTPSEVTLDSFLNHWEGSNHHPQIAICMRAPGPNLLTASLAELNLWWFDKLSECHFSDTIWGNTIHTIEYLESNCVPRDAILHGLIRMGVKDWSQPNHIQGTDMEIMRHSSSMATRLMKQLYLLEDRVS